MEAKLDIQFAEPSLYYAEHCGEPFA
jgi:hypothetical protein